jgi:nitric oxide reductase subunit C
MKLKVIHIFSALCVLFLIYSFSIYMMPMRDSKNYAHNSELASQGRLTWQKYNCQACHQLYGLGGYLGPDLTNVYSAKGKGAAWITAIVRSGVRQMPQFNLTEKEEAELVEFLKSTDASGIADPRNFVTEPTGMISKK